MKIMFTKLMELVNLYAEDKAEAIKQWNAIAFDKAQVYPTIPLKEDATGRDVWLYNTGVDYATFLGSFSSIIEMSNDNDSLVRINYCSYYGQTMTITAKPEWFAFQEKVVNFDDIKSLDDWNAIDWLAHIKLDDIDSGNSWISDEHAKVSGLVFVNWNKDNRSRIMAFTNRFPAAKFQVSITSDENLFKIFSCDLSNKVEAYLEERELSKDEPDYTELAKEDFKCISDDDIVDLVRSSKEGDTNMDTPTPEVVEQPEIVATEQVGAIAKPERRFQVQVEDCEYGYIASLWHGFNSYDDAFRKYKTNPEYFSSVEEAKASLEAISKYEREENDRDEDNEGIAFQIVEIHATVSVKPVVQTEYKYEWTGFDYGLSATTTTANSLAA